MRYPIYIIRHYGERKKDGKEGEKQGREGGVERREEGERRDLDSRK